MTRMTPDHAWTIWTGPTAPDDDALATDRENAEVVILDQRPRTTTDAIRMLDVLTENVEAGSRADRRDLVALQRLKAFLGRLPEKASLAPS